MTLHLVTVMFGAGVLVSTACTKTVACTAQQVAALPLSTACCVIMHFPHLISHAPFPLQGLPYAMASQGWALGLCMLALATGASAYSAFLLAEVGLQWAATARARMHACCTCMCLLGWPAAAITCRLLLHNLCHAPSACAAAHAARRAARAHAACAGRGDLGQARPPLDCHPPAHRHGEAWQLVNRRMQRAAGCSPAEQVGMRSGSCVCALRKSPDSPLRPCCRAGRRFADLHRRWRHFPYEYY